MPKTQKKQKSSVKRVEGLKDQLYGKEGKYSFSYSGESKITTQSSHSSDLSYLYRDLLKITIISFFAFGAQFIVYLKLSGKLF